MPLTIVDDVRSVYSLVASSQDPVSKGKEILFLTKNRGTFIKNCPGTRSYRCCGYKILHIGTFCTMDCAYCILQAYFHPPLTQLYVNHDDLMDELGNLFTQNSISRVGTGEFTDSLIWEPFTDLPAVLVSEFAEQTKAVLELKTKTVNVKDLQHITHNQKTIISWSLNTNRIVEREERGTASLSERLTAAAACESWGYKLAFHFDPVFIYDGCEDDYQEVIEQMIAAVSPESIVWISIGSFRYMPDLKPIIQERFPESKIVYGEFITGLDNKMRYFKPLRLKLYQKMVCWIKELAPEVLVYFCMEDDEIWKKSIGFKPSDKDGLPRMLDKSAAKHCGLKI